MILTELPFWLQKNTTLGQVIFHTYVKVDRHYSKKNNKQIMKNRFTGKPFIADNKKDKANEQYLVHMFKNAACSWKVYDPIECPLWVVMRFHYPLTKKGQPTKKVADLSNLLQGPEDALIKAGIIRDDVLIESYDGSRRVTNSDCHKLELYIMRYDHGPKSA